MQTLFIALAVDADTTISPDLVSKLLNSKKSLIKVKPLNKCAGEDRVFRLLCDLYLCTNKYFKGIHESKLTLISIKKQNELTPEFISYFLTEIKLAIVSDTYPIFKFPTDSEFKKIQEISLKFSDDDRIERLKPHITQLEPYFKILKLLHNPFC
jgi:hypothetical protein